MKYFGFSLVYGGLVWLAVLFVILIVRAVSICPPLESELVCALVGPLEMIGANLAQKAQDPGGWRAVGFMYALAPLILVLMGRFMVSGARGRDDD